LFGVIRLTRNFSIGDKSLAMPGSLSSLSVITFLLQFNYDNHR